jgi:soluble P-type ATPase
MLEVSIPGHEDLRLQHLVLDYNGTLACDGELLPGVAEALTVLAKDLEIHVLTADTFGKAQARLKGLPCQLLVLPTNRQDVGKLIHVRNLGAAEAVCVGNGRNDRLMLKEAALGIALIQQEGGALETILEADVVCPNILSALQLLTNPLRLVATLRS